jgi:hypothetical protein
MSFWNYENVCERKNQAQRVPEGFEKPQKKRMLRHPQSPGYQTGE